MTISWKEIYSRIVPQRNLDKHKNNKQIRIYNSYNQFDLKVDNKIIRFVNYDETEEKEYVKKLFETAISEQKNLSLINC